MTAKRYVVSVSPHVRNGRTVRSMMLWTIIALLPAALWGIYQFGFPAVLIVAASIAAAVGTEAIVCAIAKQKSSIGNLHAVLIGLMIAMMLPAGCPFWVAMVASFMGILVGKMPFGPLGGSPLSPALVGILVAVLSWPMLTISYVQPTSAADELKTEDAAPAESPLLAVAIDPSDVTDYNTLDLFVGNKKPGAIGGISPLMLILGGLILIFSRVSRWHAPVGFILGMSVAATIAHSLNPDNPGCIFQLFTGLTMFGAFFLTTEMPVTPVTPWGMFLFGLIAGGLTLLFRVTGMGSGSVAYAIIIMSLATPLFDRIAPTPFGKVVNHA